MKNSRLGLLSACIMAGGIGSAQAQTTSQFEGGKICYSYKTEISQRPSVDGVCLEGATRNETGQCITNTTFYNSCVFILNEDDSMDFGFSYWFPSGANCGLTGVAAKTDAGWHYSKDTDLPSERCEIDITMDGETITLKSEEGARCAAQCGIGAAVENLRFPMQNITSKNVLPIDLLVENIIETKCE